MARQKNAIFVYSQTEQFYLYLPSNAPESEMKTYYFTAEATSQADITFILRGTSTANTLTFAIPPISKLEAKYTLRSGDPLSDEAQTQIAFIMGRIAKENIGLIVLGIASSSELKCWVITNDKPQPLY